MNVLIVDSKSGKVITIPLVIQGMNYTPTEQEYLAKAWSIAVKDASVDPERKDDYTFQLRK